MSRFFTEDKHVNVSCFDEQSWFISNKQLFVAKGTALPPLCTEILYTPNDGKTAKFIDSEWQEVDMKPQFYDVFGNEYHVANPDSEYPDGAILETPPSINDNQELLFKNNSWNVYEKRIGQVFYDECKNEFVITGRFFELPKKHSFDPPPPAADGYTEIIVDGKWQQVEDHRGEVMFDIADASPKVINDIGVIPEGYTLDAPLTDYDEWNGDKWVTNLQLKYEADYEAVRLTRNEQYIQLVTSKVAEAVIARLEGNEEQAAICEQEALAEKAAIEQNNPWPIAPNI